MAGFKIFTVAGPGPANYEYELEALRPLSVDITEAPAEEEAFIAAANQADAIYGKGVPVTKRIIDALPNMQDDRPRQRGRGPSGRRGGDRARHPRHQLPRHVHRGGGRPRDDAAAGRASAGSMEQDRMVRDGRWKEGGRRSTKIRG